MAKYGEGAIGRRVQIPAYTDRWMMGDRYGEIIRVKQARKGVAPHNDIAAIKLDKSGKTFRFILDDCEYV